MDRKCRRIISKFSKHLQKTIDLNKIRHLVEERNIFTKYQLGMVYDPLNEDDDLFYELLCKRGHYAFSNFLNILSLTGHTDEEALLQNEFSKDYKPVAYNMKSDPLGFCHIIINKIFVDRPEPAKKMDCPKPAKKKDCPKPAKKKDCPEPAKKKKDCPGPAKKKKDYTRYGSEEDATALESLFKTLGYDVTVVWDLKGEQMLASLKQFSKNPSFSKVDSIVVFILTHGDRIGNCDVLFGTDWDPVHIRDIYRTFNNINCPMLLGKPKMFFFQACRGGEEDVGYFERKGISVDAGGLGIPTTTVTIIDHPSVTDMIAVHSTMPDHKSFRNHENVGKGLPYQDEDEFPVYERGSWLCQDIFDVFSIDYRRHDLETMLKSVCIKMNERRSVETKSKQTIHVELFGVTGIVKFGTYSKTLIKHQDPGPLKLEWGDQGGRPSSLAQAVASLPVHLFYLFLLITSGFIFKPELFGLT